MLIVTQSLIDRIVEIEIKNLRSRLEAYARRPGNPAGVYMQTFSRATAFVCEEIPVRFFNSVLGTGPENAAELEAIRAFYRAHQRYGAFEIVPGRLTEEFGRALAAQNLSMGEFHTALARTLSAADAATQLPAGIQVEVIDPEADLETFLDTYLEGWEVKDKEGSKANMREWRSNETWRFYLATVGGQPAGAGLLDIRGRTAMLGSAATKPEFRGRRVQAALIAQRTADSARAGCDLLVSGAYFGTSSMRNQQRAGLLTAFTRGVWIDSRGI